MIRSARKIYFLEKQGTSSDLNFLNRSTGRADCEEGQNCRARICSIPLLQLVPDCSMTVPALLCCKHGFSESTEDQVCTHTAISTSQWSWEPLLPSFFSQEFKCSSDCKTVVVSIYLNCRRYKENHPKSCVTLLSLQEPVSSNLPSTTPGTLTLF